MLKITLVCFIIFLGISIGGEIMALDLKSPAFQHNEFIPKKYTCESEDISPELNWSDVPSGTKSLALICDDPDAPMGTWVHWVIYDMDANKKGLPEGVPTAEVVEGGAKQGMTDFGRVGYGGPCPPPGKPHRYFFKLYCLDTVLSLKPGIRKKELLKAMEGHIIEQAELIGLYKR